MAQFSFLFPLSRGATVKVKEGQLIHPQDTLAQYVQFQQYGINLSQALGVKPKNVSQYLTTSLGNNVKSGDIIAVRPSILHKRTVISPVDGQIYALDNQNGHLTIHTSAKKISIHSPVTGKIESIKREGIVILVSGDVFGIETGQGSITWGKAKLYQNSLPTLTKDDRGEILLVRGILSRALLSKSKALRIKGIVSDKTNIPVTAGLTIVSIKRHWPTLEQQEGKIVILDPDHKKLAVINS